MKPIGQLVYAHKNVFFHDSTVKDCQIWRMPNDDRLYAWYNGGAYSITVIEGKYLARSSNGVPIFQGFPYEEEK